MVLKDELRYQVGSPNLRMGACHQRMDGDVCRIDAEFP
jgi:hypothetical protein